MSSTPDTPAATMTSDVPDAVPDALLLSGLDGFSADVVSAMTRAAAHRGDGYLNADGGDLGGGVSATLVVRHAANHLAVLQIAEAIGLKVEGLLDVGCGTGAPASTLAQHLGSALHLCDTDPAPLEVARRAFDPASTTTELSNAPTVDLVTCMDVVEHVPAGAQEAFVSALADRVRPGGLLALATPDESTYPGGWSGYEPHIACLSPVELQRLLERATGGTATVLRLAGGPFAINMRRQSWERVANAVWTQLTTRTPSVAMRLAKLGSRAAPLVEAVRQEAQDPVVVVAPARTRSTGLIGLVQL
jgi:SAM-dependent methyltransferase